ncbi:hypothetical protein JXM67_08815 [candidate division WOR-3 bacterium]|nr:hypothetical protein [candidate division WOR-3 bacterium]
MLNFGKGNGYSILFVSIFPVIAIAEPGIQLCDAPGVLEYHLEIPEFELLQEEDGETSILMEGAGYDQQPGYPRLPVPVYTFALPAGSEIVDIEVSGQRSLLDGRYKIQASLPAAIEGGPIELGERFFELYRENKARVYSGAEVLPKDLGRLQESYEVREYSLVTIALYPFFYDPVSEGLSVASYVTLRINYTPYKNEHAEFMSRFIEKGTIDPDVPVYVYNKTQAREWYRPRERLLAQPRMIVLTTSALEGLADQYAVWRRNTGFEVTVVTKEEIESTTSGVDLPQKIRNYLRSHAADYDYLFIIGHHSDLPMRIITPFANNNPGYYWDSPDITPNPSDIYYGELSKPDNQSWDKDEDGYYGETFSSSGYSDPEDSPEIGMELHIGRINSSAPTKVSNIVDKIQRFEDEDNQGYKQKSVLAGGVFTFPNENNSGTDGRFGWTVIEYILSRSVLDRTKATTLYEKEGDYPSPYSCDVDFTNENLISTLAGTDAGIFFERNHGLHNQFSRKVWTDDGDGIPEDEDITYPVGLESGDNWKLNDEKPNVAFLGSCLNAYPEVQNSLAKALLELGSAAVLAHTRVSYGQYN